MKNTINIPFTRVGYDADVENVRRMLEGDDTLTMTSEGELVKKGNEHTGAKLGDIPSNKLGISLREFLEKKNTEEEESEENNETDGVAKPLGDIPSGKLGAVQWYTRPEMQEQLAFEKAGMLKYIGTPKWGVNCGVLDDGRLFFKVRQRIKANRKNGTPLYDEVYDIMLVYQPDHPNQEWGTSVHAYLSGDNNVNRMQRRVDDSPRTPKKINHLIPDDEGMFYLCTAHVKDFGTSYDDPLGVPTAETALLAACKWLHNFECALLSKKHWEKFQEHSTL